MSTFVGKVTGFFFESPDSLYKVVVVERTDEEEIAGLPEDEVVVTGYFGTIHKETVYRFSGEVVSHPKYGQQFRVDDYSLAEQVGEAGLVAYLSGEQFKGVGKKTAQAIVDHLAGDALESLFETPERLNGIAGFTSKKQERFLEDLKTALGTDYTLIELSQMGFRPNEAQMLWQHYKEEAVELAKENPYQLIVHIDGITMAIVDRVGQKMEIQPDDERRLIGGWFEATQAICYQSGHTLLPIEGVKQQVTSLLERLQPYLIQDEELDEALVTAVRQNTLVVEHDQVTIPSLYYAELGIYNRLTKLQKASLCLTEEGQKDIQEALVSVQEEIGITYDDKQVETIVEALTHPLFLLTGGPGTGKTTLIKGMVYAYADYRGIELPQANSLDFKDCPIRLAAPTGRAAKRMQEAVGMPATTIHRLLGLTGQENQKDLREVSTEKIHANLLIIDEMSMVDVWLMNQLLKALPDSCQLILLGDQDQLPSVGPGQVFHNLLTHPDLPKRRLTHIYRQKGQSSIVQLAHAIKDGVCPKTLFEKSSDHSFIPCRMGQVPSVVAQTAALVTQKGYSLADLQVLAPMYKTPAGIEALNQALQKTLNPKSGKSQEVMIFKQAYRVGDKVIYLVNDPERGVYNGDIGTIVGIVNGKYTESKQEELVLQFDQLEVNLTKADFKNIQLAYCCSIHKAQGSEFKVVILPLVGAFHRMLQRHLIYTGLTRAKDKLILIGEPEAFQQAIHTLAKDRQTLLAHLIAGDWVLDDLRKAKMATEGQSSQILERELDEGADTVPLTGEVGKDSQPKPLKAIEDEPLQLTKSGQLIQQSQVVRGQATLPGEEGLKASQPESQVEPGFVVEENSPNQEEPGPILGPLTDRLVDAELIDPMIGMEGISLNQFKGY